MSIYHSNFATHDKKKDSDHGPAIFDPKVAFDSKGNIHIIWYINDGGNHFSIWYEKSDPNGTVLIPAMKIAPEDGPGENGEATPGFGVGPVVVVAVLVVVFWGDWRRRREGG